MSDEAVRGEPPALFGGRARESRRTRGVRMSRARLTHIASANVRGTRIRTAGLTEARIRGSVFRVLEENLLCSIASVTDSVRAHINTAYFCYSGQLELYFLSHPRSLHCRNLATNSSIGMTIFSSSQQLANPGRGLQLFGTCRQASGARARRAEQLYGKRFPAYASWKATLKTRDAGREYRFYQFVVRRFKILDESALGEAVFVHGIVNRRIAT